MYSAKLEMIHTTVESFQISDRKTSFLKTNTHLFQIIYFSWLIKQGYSALTLASKEDPGE